MRAIADLKKTEREEMEASVDVFLASGGQITTESIRTAKPSNKLKKLTSLQKSTVQSIIEIQDENKTANANSLASKLDLPVDTVRARLRLLSKNKVIMADRFQNVIEVLRVK